MNVKLYCAISLDGFIAKSDGDSDWVSESDWPSFESEINKAGCIIVGRKTFDQFQDDLYPIENVTNIVVTSDSQKVHEADNVIFTSKSPGEVLEIAGEKGHDTCLLIGGGQTNASFLEANLINEVIVSVHPLILGNGIRLFESNEVNVDLEKINVEEMADDLVKITYKVKK